MCCVNTIVDLKMYSFSCCVNTKLILSHGEVSGETLSSLENNVQNKIHCELSAGILNFSSLASLILG